MALGDLSPIALLCICLLLAWHQGIFLKDSFAQVAVLSSVHTASGQRYNIPVFALERGFGDALSNERF